MSKKHKEQKNNKKNYTASASWVVALGIIGSIVYFAVTAPKVAEGDLVSSSGVHYHPSLSIVIDGESIVVPNNVGLSGPAHNPIHTHEEGGGMLHLEFDGIVKKTDTSLGKFFDVWGKEWTTTSFMNLPIDATHTLTMKVNGEVSTEYRNLHMKDKQTIELVYKSVTP